MYKHLLPSMMLLLLSTQSYAVDLNNSNEIIEQASQSTIEIQNEMDTLISTKAPSLGDENQTIVTAVVETNQTEVENSIPDPTIASVLLIEENLSAEVATKVEETNTTTLNKETFDMSKGTLEKGEAIYKEQLKNICETKKSELSEHYSQDEWEAFAEEGKFENAIFDICPQIEPSYNKEWSPDLYQFYYQHARDSEEIPEC